MRGRFLGAAALGAAAAIGGAVLATYRRGIGAIRNRVRDGSQIARTVRGAVEYQIEGSGPLALVVHGAGGGYDQGLLTARSFGRLRAIAPSRFGYLRTPLAADGSPAAQADAHAALLDSLGVDSAIIIGESAGAPSALELALRHPERVRALVLLVPRGYAPGREVEVPATPANQLLLRIILSGADFAYWAALRTRRSMLVKFMGVPPALEARAPAAERARVDAMLESVLPLSWRVTGIRNDAATAMEPQPLERIAAPTLIVTASDDLFGTLPAAEFMASRIPDAKLIVLDNGGHLLVGRLNEVNRAIARFLSGAGVLE